VCGKSLNAGWGKEDFLLCADFYNSLSPLRYLLALDSRRREIKNANKKGLIEKEGGEFIE
jgi:hypothetical protein